MGQSNSSANSPVHRTPGGSADGVPQCTAGGSGGGDLIVDVVDALGREIRKQTSTLTELSTLSYEDFCRSLAELNAL